MTARPVIDVVMPARNEAVTVADNVAAGLGCRWVREVIVVDDGSEDETADRARTAGPRSWPGRVRADRRPMPWPTE